MMASPENWPGPWATMRISVAPVGRSACTSPLTTTKNGTSLSPTSTSTSPRAIGRRRPRAAMRAICALVSVGNSRSACEGAVEANGSCGSGAFTGHPPESLSIHVTVALSP